MGLAEDQARLRALLLERSVKHGSFTLASGQTSSYYIDCRLTTMSAEGQVLTGKLGLGAIRGAGWAPDAIGGLTMGADPVAYAIAAASFGSPPAVDAFSVRKTPKEHGTGRLIEGNFSRGSKVVVVEDVITSGGSALRAVDAVRDEGGEVLGVLAVVDRQGEGRGRIEAAGVPVVVLETAGGLGLV
ncbi:MAG TPA: orotate phosphoribosyltransferase [Gemmatimonadales bacterium]|nr:orotate phosphoribosyltransferase [Gemmatimonadales bacterium]